MIVAIVKDMREVIGGSIWWVRVNGSASAWGELGFVIAFYALCGGLALLGASLALYGLHALGILAWLDWRGAQTGRDVLALNLWAGHAWGWLLRSATLGYDLLAADPIAALLAVGIGIGYLRGKARGYWKGYGEGYVAGESDATTGEAAA